MSVSGSITEVKPLLENVGKNYPDNTMTKEYLKYLDDTYPFYPLINDTIIKYLAKENPKWFLCFNVITCYLGLDKINKEIIFHDKEKNGLDLYIAVSGGSQPALVAEAFLHSSIHWERVHFFFTDERYVPLTHPDSNYDAWNRLFFSIVPLN